MPAPAAKATEKIAELESVNAGLLAEIQKVKAQNQKLVGAAKKEVSSLSLLEKLKEEYEGKLMSERKDKEDALQK